MSPIARVLAVVMALGAVSGAGRSLQGQEVEIERPGPPALDDFESDKNKDGVPDGWYNLRDAKLVAKGGVVGPHCLRFECHKPGRPSRLSRAFGVDGQKTEALIIGLWIRLDQIQTGARLGADPQLMIDFLGDKLHALTRGVIGPWTASSFGNQWTRVSKRIAVPRGAHDAIMSVGLVGATGIMEIDGMTIEEVPVGGRETTNLVVNGDFELGDPDPANWTVENGAVRAFPAGAPSPSVLELTRSSSRALTALGVPVEPFARLDISLLVRASGLRGAGGAGASLFFLDDSSRPLPGGLGQAIVFRWAGSNYWHPENTSVTVPNGAVRAVFRLKTDSGSALFLDDVAITASPDRTRAPGFPITLRTTRRSGCQSSHRQRSPRAPRSMRRSFSTPRRASTGSWS